MRQNDFFGYKASCVYEKCINSYNFDPQYSGRFGRQQRLYVGGATPEGYGVWMIANSNRTGTKSGKWVNVIAGNYSWIEETWTNNPVMGKNGFDNCDRVVFSKEPHRSNGYIFLGIYRPVSYDAQTKTRRFVRMSDTYDS